MLKRITAAAFLLLPFISSAQNKIGIGTNTPTERLDVVGNIKADTIKSVMIKISGAGAGPGKVLTSDSTGWAVWQTPAAAGGGTLTDAYNFGGAGSGRIINATTGSLRVDGDYGFQVFGGSSSVSLDDPGPGNRMLFSTSRAAFRSGSTSTQNIWSGNNLGYASSAMGLNSNAAGFVAFAAGSTANANGENSVAMGTNVVSNADRSTTFGFNNINNGYGSLVIGKYNDTLYAKQTAASAGTALFVVGNGSAIASRSNAMVVLNNGRTGLGTNNPAERLEVEGNVLADTIKTSIVKITGGAPGTGKVLTSDATGNASWQTAANGGTLTDAYNFGGPAAGRIINAATAALRVDGNYGLQVYGQLGNQFVENPGIGSRMFFSAGEGAFRAGYLNANNPNMWDKDSVGFISVAMGSNSNAYADYSVAIGNGTISRGINAVSIGALNMAGGQSSTAIGQLNAAMGNQTVAIGYQNTAIGANAVAVGLGTVAEGLFSFAAGRNTYAKGTGSIALGDGGDATGVNAVSIGKDNIAAGESSFSVGNGNRANANFSAAIGQGLVANGYGGLVVGRYNDTSFAVQPGIAANSDLFTVGNGYNAGGGRNTAFTVLNSGFTGVNTPTPTSMLSVNGSLALAPVTINSSLSIGLDANSSVCFLNGTGTIGLPAANTCTGRIYILVNQSNAAKNFNGTSYINFSGASVTSIPANSGIKIISDGTNWRLIP